MFFARYDEHTSEEIRASKKQTSYSKIQKLHRQNKQKTRNIQLKKKKFNFSAYLQHGCFLVLPS